MTASLCVPAMSSPSDDSSSTDSSSTESYGPQANKHHEPQKKKQKTLPAEADRAEKHLAPNQPGRVQLNRITWHPQNRGGQGILPIHVHDVAKDICTNGTSSRRYGQVRLVEVPERLMEVLLSANEKKAKQNPLLADFMAMSHTETVYAALRCTHFVEAHKVISESGRMYNDQAGCIKLRLLDDDCEGKMIQEKGVQAIVYSAELWDDSAAILGLLREDNLNAQLAKSETELDAFGHVSRLISGLTASCPEGTVIKTDDVMAIIAEQGYGTMPSQYAEMLLDCLLQVCNGRVSIPAKTYAEIHSLHPKGHPLVKIFLLMETYRADFLSEEHGQHKAIRHTGPQAKRTKTLDVKAIK